MFEAGTICSKLGFEHLPENFEHLAKRSEHLPENSEHPGTLHKIAEPVGSLQKTPRERVEMTILRLCEEGFLPLDELAKLLDRRKDSLRNHYINPMLEDGRIEARYKNIRNHPRQGYRTVPGMEIGEEA
jgi:ATP-dependent DNA helicase RecG